MPLQPKELSKKEVIVAREEAQSTLANALHLLLRGGAPCYLEFERHLLHTCENAHLTTRFTGADGRVHFVKRQYLRANPEDVKAAFRSCGVLLMAEDYRRIRVAFSDPVGFVLADPFLSALCPAGQIPLTLARALVAALPQSEEGAESCGVSSANANVACAEAAAAAEVAYGSDTDGCLTLPDLELGSVTAALAALFAVDSDNGAFGRNGAIAKKQQEEEVGSSSSNANATVMAFLSGARNSALHCFTHALYPTGRVPGLSVVNFLAAELLVRCETGDGNSTSEALCTALERRLPELAGRLRVAPAPILTLGSATNGTHSPSLRRPSPQAVAAASVNRDKRSSIADFCMTHTGVPRREEGFEYYAQLEDRRDEWLRGRDARDARPAYLKHTVGYGGHLPELRFHYGRTFHVIEETLPQLTKPTPARAPVPADAFGPGRALKGTPMTQHHFTFA